jgi:hypothetical protein
MKAVCRNAFLLGGLTLLVLGSPTIVNCQQLELAGPAGEPCMPCCSICVVAAAYRCCPAICWAG